jgi:hypothetical protein
LLFGFSRRFDSVRAFFLLTRRPVHFINICFAKNELDCRVEGRL